MRWKDHFTDLLNSDSHVEPDSLDNVPAVPVREELDDMIHIEDLPAISRWEDPCESSPQPTTTSLRKYYPRNTVRFQTRTMHYGHDFLCPAGAGEMQGTRA